MSPSSLCNFSLFNPNFTFHQNPHTKVGSLLISNINVYSFSKQKFNLRFCNLSKRVSEESFSLRNGGELLKVKCGDLKCSENGNGNDNDDVYYMRKALDLARKAIGFTSPNPMVGCVIVKDAKIVGQGFHPKAGQPHAEVFALRDAGELAENATAYVTLEPCNHYGRTPPCSEALIKAKVKKVVVGMVDPNPIVLTRGIDRLREAGIEVIVGVEEESCKELVEAFIHKMLYGKPFVALRYSITINGAFSDQLGEKATECGGYYSRLLQEYDAVVHAPTLMTQGISFYQSQEPNACQPVHIVIVQDSKSLSHILKFLRKGDFKAILFADTELLLDPHLSQTGIETVILDQIRMDAILDYCSRQGFCNVLFDLRGKHDDLEEILGAGIATNLIQKALVEVLPVWAGSEVSSSSVPVNLPERKRLKNISTKYQGDIILLEAYF